MASLYQHVIRPILFQMNPEDVHNFTLQALKTMTHLRIPVWLMEQLCSVSSEHKTKLWDLEFPNSIGLAAGMDKDGEVIEAMFAMGFGFLELGTVTPLPQSGNPKPRLFRYPDTHAIVNRMGFNNAGVEALKNKVFSFRQARPDKGVIGINIGKQKETPIEAATADYVKGFETVADLADYIAVNISSPNTQDLRKLQESEPLKDLLSTLYGLNTKRLNEGKRKVPTLLKIAPDLEQAQIESIVQLVVEHQWDGIIATNTTIDRSGDRSSYETPGGLSGRPLKQRSTEVIQIISKLTSGKLPIIGIGGIETAEDVSEKIDAGAHLVQVYSGFIYQGPRMVREIVKKMESSLKKDDPISV
jgi:dihydroorotate dehydrogenase